MSDHASFEHEIFADSMLQTSWTQRSIRSWSTLSSFALQAITAGLLMLIPILSPVALPFLRPISTPIMLGLSPRQPIEVHATPSFHSFGVAGHGIIFPSHMPIITRDFETETSGPSVDPSGPYVPGIRGPGVISGIHFSSGERSIIPLPPPTSASHPLRLSHMSEGDLLRKVQPAYPALARSAHIQGQVVLSAIISKEGGIENLRMLTGHPMLVHAALEAVSQWRYRPYILNGEPVEVETQITVNFSLSGG
jgi:periplasmic protein TonB